MTFVRNVPYPRERQNYSGASLLYLRERDAFFSYAHIRDIADKSPARRGRQR
jgi:hypothetical protein